MHLRDSPVSRSKIYLRGLNGGISLREGAMLLSRQNILLPLEIGKVG